MRRVRLVCPRGSSHLDVRLCSFICFAQIGALQLKRHEMNPFCGGGVRCSYARDVNLINELLTHSIQRTVVLTKFHFLGKLLDYSINEEKKKKSYLTLLEEEFSTVSIWDCFSVLCSGKAGQLVQYFAPIGRCSNFCMPTKLILWPIIATDENAVTGMRF